MPIINIKVGCHSEILWPTVKILKPYLGKMKDIYILKVFCWIYSLMEIPMMPPKKLFVY